MKELKVKKDNVLSVYARLKQVTVDARKNILATISLEAMRNAYERRLELFDETVSVFIKYAQNKEYVLVIHYEGEDIVRASYIEVQLCRSIDHDDLIGAITVKL